MLETGLDCFLKKNYRDFRKMRLGVLCNQASVTPKLKHISEVLLLPSLKLDIRAFFGPQHGIRGEKQDNMVESTDFIDPRSNRPVYSLYSKTRIPTDAMFDEVDCLLVDLQDIGTRIYTFMYTLANCMRVAKRLGTKVVVLDRPNPIGCDRVEGNVLEAQYTSFVGQYPIATRHGMTMGELAQLFNTEFEIGCDLTVVPLRGYSRSKMAPAYHRPWVPPSPNIPRFEAALTFPGTVLFEGTNISEGRGTTMPFEYIGAPYIDDPDSLAHSLNQRRLPGVFFRAVFFQPTFHKGKDQVCGGVHLHVTDAGKFNAFECGVILLNEIAQGHKALFKWKQPPYEYEHDRMPIDLIAGTDRLRLAIDSGNDLKPFLKDAAEQAKEFKKLSLPYRIYRSK